MYTLPTIQSEVSAKVTWLEANNGRVLHKQWLITAVLSDHASIEGEDKDFALCCARYAVEQSVDRYFRTMRQSEEDDTRDDQQILPGFERLQKRYLVKRDNEQVIVRVEDMSDDELRQKAQQHAEMGAGHFLHQRELLRFIDERQAQPLSFVG